MARYKKKFIAFLIVVLLCSSALVVLSAQSKNQESISEIPKFQTSSLFNNDPNLLTREKSTLGSREMFFKMMFSVILVIALGAGAIYISKKFLPRITNMPGKEIHVLETIYLGPRKAVHLLKIENQRLLIGSTNENITLLAHITDNFTDVQTEQINQEVDNARI